MVEGHIDAVKSIRECRERKIRGDDYANRLDGLIDVGRGIVNDDSTVDLRAAEALKLGKGNRIL